MTDNVAMIDRDPLLLAGATAHALEPRALDADGSAAAAAARHHADDLMHHVRAPVLTQDERIGGAKMSRPTPAQQLGKRIQALRKAAGMNQYQLADRLGMSRSAVAFWETGRESSARKHIPRLARLFGVSEEAFLTDQHDESHEMTLTSDEHDLLVLYRMLDATDKLSAQKWIEKRVVRQGQ